MERASEPTAHKPLIRPGSAAHHTTTSTSSMERRQHETTPTTQKPGRLAGRRPPAHVPRSARRRRDPIDPEPEPAALVADPTVSAEKEDLFRLTCMSRFKPRSIKQKTVAQHISRCINNWQLRHQPSRLLKTPPHNPQNANRVELRKNGFGSVCLVWSYSSKIHCSRHVYISSFGSIDR
jgi:hypothetical protein